MKLFKEVLICLAIWILLIFAAFGISTILQQVSDNMWITQWIPAGIVGFGLPPICGKFAAKRSHWIALVIMGAFALGLRLASVI